MAKLLKLRRGTTSQHGSFTGAEGEVTVDTDKETLVIHDGSTAGGHPVAAEDMANVSSASIVGRLGTGSIAHAKLAGDAVDGDNLADNACDSEHYTDGSIDHEHLSSDCIDGDNIQDDVINSEHIAAGAIDLEHMSSESVDEDNLKISNAGTNGQFLSKQSGDSGGLTWATAGGVASIADDSITEIKLDIHADPSGTNKFLGYTSNGMEWAVPPDTNTQLTEEQVEDFVGGMLTGNTETGITVTYEDSDGTIDFVVAPEGDTVKSTGESGGTKFLREDGDGTCSWQTVTASVPTTITVADESSDTTCNIAYFTAATGDLAPKTGTNLTFNSSTGELEADILKDDKGNVRAIPQNNQGSSYDLVAADAGKCITSAGGVTVNQSIFASGDAVTIVNDSGSDITITQGSNVTIYNASNAATGNRTLASRGMASMWFSAHNYAYISGAGLS